jgi:hypothetical protein
MGVTHDDIARAFGRETERAAGRTLSSAVIRRICHALDDLDALDVWS